MSILRKVQRTPSGTFFVCLPKAWAEKYNLERGAVLALNETSDGKLLLDARHEAESSPKVAVLKPGAHLSREIIGKYLLGFDIIQVEAKDRISFEVRDTVKKTVSRLIGLEIVEENYSRIVIQCLLEVSGFPPEKNLRRGYAIVTGMHRDGIGAVINNDVHLAKSVVARDDEVNRLYFLLVRILRTIIQNPSLSEKLNVRPIDCLDYRLAASLVEAIGDECVNIANTVIEIGNLKLTKDLKKLLMEFHAICFQAHENALKAFLSNDIELAEKVRDTREKIEKTFTEIGKAAKEQSFDFVPQILALASSLKQIYEHSVDVADLVMPKEV
ncbi:MAG: PhoU domain-containing protein [Candidatus Bathyarchaeota archaeon]|nr:PhoU domain-containing protein [Candidatus Bathyarchaeota archaeon]